MLGRGLCAEGKERSGDVPWNTPAVRGQASGKGGGWRGGERGIRIQVRFLRSHRVMGKNDAVKECGFISSFLVSTRTTKGKAVH